MNDYASTVERMLSMLTDENKKKALSKKNVMLSILVQAGMLTALEDFGERSDGKVNGEELVKGVAAGLVGCFVNIKANVVAQSELSDADANEMIVELLATVSINTMDALKAKGDTVGTTMGDFETVTMPNGKVH